MKTERLETTEEVMFCGYCEETNAVYEFFGCPFHGHCKYDDPKKQRETYIRKDILEKLGYNIELIYSKSIGC